MGETSYRRAAPARTPTKVRAIPQLEPMVAKVEAALRSGVLSSPPSPKAGAMPVESAPPEPDLVAEGVPDADGDAVALPLKGVMAPQG